MGITVGMPTMFLGRQKGKQGKRTGNAKAILCEALKERWTSDPDYNPDRTQDNIYLTDITSGLELYQKWKDRADSYVQVQKNGRERKLRDDAHIGFAGICKPSADSEYGNYTEQQQIQFCRDSFTVLQQVYAKYGVTLDYGVIQVDEGNVHLHYGGSDADFRLAKRIGLKLFNDLNKGDYVRLMHEKGWNVQPLEGYDPQKAAEMTPEQLEEYKQEQIERKKSRKSGKSARQYKAEQEQKKSKALQAEIEQQKQELQRQQEQLKRDRELLAKRETEVTEREYAADERAETLYAEHNTPTTRISVAGYTLIKKDDLRALQEDKLEQQKRIQDERETQLYAPVEPVKTNLFGGVKNAADIINAQQAQITVLQARSDRKTIYDSDLQRARQARSDAERLRADAERTNAAAAEKDRKAAENLAQAEKYKCNEVAYIKSEAKKKAEKIVDKAVKKAVSDADSQHRTQMQEMQEQNAILQERLQRYQSYLQDRNLTQDYNKWDYDRRGRFDGVADTKQNTYTFDYDAGE